MAILAWLFFGGALKTGDPVVGGGASGGTTVNIEASPSAGAEPQAEGGAAADDASAEPGADASN